MAALRASLRTRVDDAVWDTFSDAYDKAYAYYENDKLEDCIKECSGILGEEASLPRYIRICTLILLALVVKEEVDFHEARTEAESLYGMTRSFHRIGADQDIDEALDSLRESLDELKQMEMTEWGISEEEIEEKDSAALVQAQSLAEENAARHALEEDDEEALKKADELAALNVEDESQHPVPKIRVSEVAFAPFKPVLPQQHLEGASSPRLKKKSSSAFGPSSQPYVPPHRRVEQEP